MKMQTPIYEHKNSSAEQAIAMIKGQLATNGIHDLRIINALATADRNHFVPDSAKDCAYVDEELRLCANRYLLEPLLFATMLNLADFSQHHKVLDIGAGYGYSSAVISQLAGEVFGVEESAELVASARKKLKSANFDCVELITAPLENGCTAHAPYDRIFINGVLNKVPKAIEAQLAEDGLIVALIANGKKFATGKVACNVVVGKKIDGEISYLEKRASFAFYLKKNSEPNLFVF